MSYSDIERATFADGTVWDKVEIDRRSIQTTAGDDLMLGSWYIQTYDGGAGNDIIHAGGNNDTLIGGLGDDDLQGDSGNDMYVYNLGDGDDVIYDYNWGNDEADRIVFGAGITPDMIHVGNNGGSSDVLVTFQGNAGSILIENQWNGYTGIEFFEFADGTIWDLNQISAAWIASQTTDWSETIYGADSNDTISGDGGIDHVLAGNGDDQLMGGDGADLLEGGSGNDTYVYNLGDGDDIIYDYNWGNDEADRIVFGVGITPDMIRLSKSGSGNDLQINFEGNAGSIIVQNQWDGYTGVEFFEFADGTIWDEDQLVIPSSEMDDNIQGTSAPETFRGGSGNDTIQGNGGNDLIYGDSDNDTLDGGGGDDTYVWARGDGTDTIFDEYQNGSADKLVLQGVNPGEVTLSRNGNDFILTIAESTPGAGDGGSVRLILDVDDYYDRGVDQISFADGTSWTRAAMRTMWMASAGTPGNNTITGFSSNDIIVGGAGNDTLNGAGGDDTYVWARGDGIDTIFDEYNNGSADKLVLQGVNPGGVTLSRNGNDFILTIAESTSGAGDGGSVRLILDTDDYYNRGVDQISFADGTVWTRATMRTMWLATAGTAGNDTIDGFSSNDTIVGRAGNDTMNGGGGDDTYLWTRGDGNDSIFDEYNNGSADKLVLQGVNPGEVTLSRNGNDFILTIAESTPGADDGGSVRLTLDTDDYYNRGVDQISFANGAVWTRAMMRDMLAGTSSNNWINGGAGNDTINGSDGNDTVAGGTGDDVIYESGGEDTYVWNRGDGNDSIRNYGGWDSFNALQFGTGISRSDLSFSRVGTSSDIKITIAGDSGSFTFVDGFNAWGDNQIDLIRFDDGSAMSRAEYINAVVASEGTSGNDNIRGSRLDDVIDGGAGDDVINDPSDGNDTVSGGTGDDVIYESAGDDTYVWSRGDGNDRVQNYGGWDGTNTLQFGAGISRSDLSFSRVGTSSDLKITIAGDSGSFTLVDGLNAWSDNLIDVIRFDDGSTMSRAEYMAAAVAGQETSGNDDIYGTRLDDVIDGGTGNDALNGNDGNDTVSGGAGDDVIYESGGDDTYVWNRGDGNDSIRNYGGWDGTNTLQFGAGIGQSDVIVWYEGSDVHIGVEGDAGSVVLVDQRYTNDGIDRILFADGSSWTRATFLAQAIAATSQSDTLTGTTGADTLRGLAGDDKLSGLAGNDLLKGDDGNDTLDGGSDNDTLIGGAGNDALYGDGYVAAGSNLVINGSFEDLGSTATYHDWGANVDVMPGWVRTNSALYELGPNTYNTDGQYFLDMEGYYNNMDIHQDVQGLTAGQKYILQFDASNRGNSASSSLNVYWNGQLIDTGQNLSSQMKTLTFVVEAAAGTNVLRFQGTGVEDNPGAPLDNVRLFATQPVTGGDDVLTGGAGNDLLDGGAGNDTAVYSGAMADYTVSTSNGVVTVTDNQPTVDGNDGTDTLTGIETLQFKDGSTSLAAPIVLDLDGNGVHLVDKAASGVRFDWNGDGRPDRTGWMSPGDGLLALDRNGDGTVSGADELSFVNDIAGASSDLAGLKAFDTNGDGELSSADDAWSRFGVWSDANGDGKVDPGEFLTMAQAGIASLDLTGTPTQEKHQLGENLVVNTGSFTRTDGTTGGFNDVAFSYEQTNKLVTLSDGSSLAVRDVLANAERFIQAAAAFGLQASGELTADNDPAGGIHVSRWQFVRSSAIG